MNLTTQNISQQFLGFNKLKSLALPLGILVLIVMMVIPLPSFLLDIFFTTNILLSLLILMVGAVIALMVVLTYLPVFHLGSALQSGL